MIFLKKYSERIFLIDRNDSKVDSTFHSWKNLSILDTKYRSKIYLKKSLDKKYRSKILLQA